MNRELMRRAEGLFLELAPLPPDQRAARLDEACAGDAELREEVGSLLAVHDERTDFLEPVRPPQAGRGDAALPVRARVGAYTILGVVGSGGMGIVYVAEQERPRRTVALKLIRRGLATPSMLRRFEREAEVLGRLQHPGIAQIYEAGVADTGDGPQPFIAMELVRGHTLIDHADAAQLGTRERIDLVARICDAVQHAHQRGVIHRDLKPANILVADGGPPLPPTTPAAPTLDAPTPPPGQSPSAGGQPKVLDFGVARAADPDVHITTMRTSVGQIIGTLAYMAPEQVTGDPAEVDTRADVYSLGVILYQLLAGRLPHDLSGRTIPEALRVIREEEPRRLSSISAEFRGDLETIVSKAIEKDRARRYQSAAELAEDLRRFIRGEAVLARQNSSFYILRKQLARYRWVFRAATAAIAALLAFAVYAASQARVQARSADRERQARYEADVARFRADNQRAEAESARARADALGAQLAVELSRARVELGRLEANLHRMALAEQTLWAEYLADPSSTAASWALWELYNRFPCRWTREVAQLPRAGAVSGDGGLLAVGTHGGEVVLLNARTGEELARTGPLGHPVLCVAAMRDAAYAGLGDGSIIRTSVHDAANPVRLAGETPHPGGVRALLLAPDESALVSAGADGRVLVWDVATGGVALDWRAHDDAVAAMTISDDGSRLFTAPARAGEGAPLRVWDARNGSLIRELPMRPRVAPVALALLDRPPRLLVGDFDRRLLVIDLGSGETTVPLPAWKGPITNVRPSPDGRRLLLTAAGSPVVLDAATFSTVFEQGGQRQTIVASDWTDDDSFAVLCADGVARSLLASPSPAMRLVRLAEQWAFGVDIDPSGSLLAATDSRATLHIFELPSMRPLHRLGLDESGRARAVRFFPSRGGPSGTPLLAVGNSAGCLRIIDPRTGDVLSSMNGARSEIYALDLHPDQDRIAVGYGDGRLCVWSTESRSVVLELPRQARRVEGVAFSPDGGLLAATGQPGAVTIWEARSGDEVATLRTSAMPWGVAFTPDGSSLMASLFDGAVDVFDVESRGLVRTIQAHQRLTPALAISRDGTLLATGSEDGSLKLWDTAGFGRLVSFEPGTGEIISVAFDPSSRWLVATSAGGQVILIELHSSLPFMGANEAYARELVKRPGRVETGPPLRRQ